MPNCKSRKFEKAEERKRVGGKTKLRSGLVVTAAGGRTGVQRVGVRALAVQFSLQQPCSLGSCFVL